MSPLPNYIVFYYVQDACGRLIHSGFNPITYLIFAIGSKLHWKSKMYFNTL